MRTIRMIAASLLAVLLPAALHAQEVTRHPQPAEALGQRWAWAEQQARQRGLQDYWIGYSITRLMGEDSYIGHYDGSRRSRGPALEELITGEAAAPAPQPSGEEAVREAAKQALDRQRGDAGGAKDEGPRVQKEVALLFGFRGGEAVVRQVTVSNLSRYVDLKDRPLLWLGAAGDAESLGLLTQRFEEATSGDVREELTMAIGVHEDVALVRPRLQAILTGDEPDDVRKAAAFWMGQLDDPEALQVLVRTAQADRSREVRKQAVFAVSQVDLDAATEALIDLARGAEDREVREQAIFWLGQEASEKATAALKDFVYSEEDTEVQKQAVFALSQLPDEDGLPMLIDVARTHQNPEVRKQAIFWLGQSGDPRALDVLIELVRGR